ncbi:MAG TPA: chain length determinant protein tyrosine kinase EpsG [Thiobacillaceae bacterium]|nr:chain length determinant protein tyrosine kinase EpsG [Thiobacillaceae bacterium]
MEQQSIVEQTMSAPRRGGKSIGHLLLESGKINAQDAERVLKAQKEQNLRFGEAAIRLGLVKEDDIQQVLAQQFDYPYLAPGEGNFSADLAAAYQPFSPQVEALRALRSQLMLRWFTAGNKALAIVGANAGDGASYLAANLAIVFSQLGERTLLIDTNMRNPQLNKLFKLGNGMGLSDVLAGRADLSTMARIAHFRDLTLLPAGTPAPNPAELLSRGNMMDLLTQLGEHFDVILMDTQPAEEAADFQTVAARAQGALIAVRKNKARIREVAGIKDMVQAAGAQVVGAVVNDH